MYWNRCSNYNNNISKSGAFKLFQLLLAYLEEQSNEKTHTECSTCESASPAERILPTTDSGLSSNIDSTMAPFQSPPPCSMSTATSSTSLPLPTTVSSPTAEVVNVNDTPRKKCRRSALQKSRLRNSGKLVSLSKATCYFKNNLFDRLFNCFFLLANSSCYADGYSNEMDR